MASQKRSAWSMCLAAGLVVSLAVPALAQNEGKKELKSAPGRPAAKETVKAQPPAEKKDAPAGHEMPADEPGEMHKFLAKFEGKWSGTVKHSYDPSQPPTESQTSGKQWMEFGGRYLFSTFEGDMGPEAGGQRFRGHGIMGYNNTLKKFQSTWVDNMSTAVENNAGTLDASGKVLTLTGNMTNAMAGGTVKARWVITWTGPDSYTEDFYMPGPDGKEFKTMELNFKRAGKSEADKKDKPKEKKEKESSSSN